LHPHQQIYIEFDVKNNCKSAEETKVEPFTVYFALYLRAITSAATQKLSFSLWLNPINPYNSLQNFLPESGYFGWKCCCHCLPKSENVSALPVPFQNREPLVRRQVALVGLKCLIKSTSDQDLVFFSC